MSDSSDITSLNMTSGAVVVPDEFDTAAGGNSKVWDVNIPYYEANAWGHVAWMLAASCIVYTIIPGLGLFYSGLARRKAAATLVYLSFAVTSVTGVQWFVWGYSLAYADNGSSFLGTLTNAGLRNVIAEPVGYIPEILYCIYQCMFAEITVLIMIAGGYERTRILPLLIFCFCWATVVYCPIAYWTWNSNGWLTNLGSLDFAGGGPVHISSGCGALAMALVVGRRKDPQMPAQRAYKYPAHNTTLIAIGAALIWFGWFGFNGGSTGNASVRSAYVLNNTNLAACTGVLGWSAMDIIFRKGKVTLVGACEGVVAGLVGITPAAGFVPVYFAGLIGFLTAVGCYACNNVNAWLGVDEGLEAFKLHTIGGIIGSFLTGLFAADWVGGLDGVTEASGWVNEHYIQLGYQLAAITSTVAWSFTVSLLLMLIINYIPYLHFRVSEQEELDGIDKHILFDEVIGERDLESRADANEVGASVFQGYHSSDSDNNESSSTPTANKDVPPPPLPQAPVTKDGVHPAVPEVDAKKE